ANLNIEPSVSRSEMRLESHSVDGDWTEIFEHNRSPQPKRHLPAIRLAQAHVGGRRLRAQLPIVELPHQMTLAVELNLDVRLPADHQLVVGLEVRRQVEAEGAEVPVVRSEQPAVYPRVGG